MKIFLEEMREIKNFSILLCLFAVLFGVLWHFLKSLTPDKSYLFGIVLWVVMSTAFLYLPHFGVKSGGYTRDQVARAFYWGGLLLIGYGSVSATSVLAAAKAAHIADKIAEATQISMLALTAVTGGAFCSDAILGVELDERSHQISWRSLIASTLVFVIACSIVASHFGADGFEVVELVIFLGLGTLPLVVAAWASSWKDEQSRIHRRPFWYIACGFWGVAMAVLGLFLIEPSIDNEMVRDFMKNLLPAFSAAIGACLLARAMESNVHRLDMGQWAQHFTEYSPGTEVSVHGSTIILAVPATTEQQAVKITIKVSDFVVRALKRGSEVLRIEIRDYTITHVRDKVQRVLRKEPACTDIPYNLENYILPARK
jgi:hypothetical protein